MFCNAGVMSSSKQDVLDFDTKGHESLHSQRWGVAASVKHTAQPMVAGSGCGSIICTASIMGTMGADLYIDYCMSEHAVLGLVRSASKQLGAGGMHVNCMLPSAVGTPLLCRVFGIGEGEGGGRGNVQAVLVHERCADGKACGGRRGLSRL